MATARLGFRPALVALGRPAGFAVCQPLRKSVLRRHAGAGTPPLPRRQDDTAPPRQQADVPPPPHQQADLPPSWLPMTIFTLQGRLFYGIGLLLTGALAAWAGQVENGMFQWAIALIILLQPLHDD